ncbi:MAG: GyrI-like domain-containing protein [Bacteroidales bacterium]
MEVRADIHDKIQKVLLHLHGNLGEKHSLESLSKIGNISPYYFHRLIRMYLQEPIWAYVKRIRLEAGLRFLQYTDEGILDIAIKLGYETQSAFTKAFSLHFGMSPTKARAKSNRIMAEVRKENDGSSLLSCKPEFRYIPDMFFAYAYVKGFYGNPDTPLAWERLREYFCKNNYFTSSSSFFGLCYDDPKITPCDSHRYQACISLEERSPVKGEGIYFSKFNGGKFMTFIHKGPYKDLNDSMSYIAAFYLTDPKIQLRDYHATLHFYLNNPNNTPPEELLTEVLFPIE